MGPTELIVIMGLEDPSLYDRLDEYCQQSTPGNPPHELLNYMRDTARAVDFLNSKSHKSTSGMVAIQHCDIWPQNISIAAGSGQLCDLRLAGVLDNTRQTRAAFSAASGAPECCAGTSPSFGTDQYALAVSYVELRTGQLPLEDVSSHARAIKKHLDSNLELSKFSALNSV